MSSLDYLNLCRLCLVKDRVSAPIFEDDGDARQIFLKITACLPVKVTREDKLPKKICDECVYKVELCYQFWNTTANAEKQLMQWLGEVNMEDKQDYVLNPNGMKPGQSNENRLDSTVMQQVSEHQNNMNMGMMDNINLGMPMMMSSTQQVTSVPMDNSNSSVQNIQAIAGPSTQTTHDQIAQSQTDTRVHQEEEEDSSEEEENTDDECDGDEGLPIKEEGEEDPNSSRTIEPTTFVNVSLACDEAGPSGLQQQKIADMPEMVMSQAADVDPKTGNKKPAEICVKNELDELDECEDYTLVSILVKEEDVKEEKCNVKLEIMNLEHNYSESTENSRTSFSRTLRNNMEDPTSEGITRQNHSDVKKQSNKLSFYKCDVCTKLFRSKYLLEDHLVAHSDVRPYQCDICGKFFKRKSTLTVHKRIHAHKKKLCDVCGRAFVQASQLATHYKRHFETLIYTKHCEICNKGFFTNSELHAHMNVKHDAKEHVCTSCNKAFCSNDSLMRHLKIHDPNFKSVKHQCEFCGKIFVYKNSLLVHIKSHTGENRYDCHYCGKSVLSKGSLRDHLRLHGGEKSKSLICDICGKAFHKRATLILHRRSHTGEKPYSCNICGKSYTQHSSLNIHKRYHTGQRPYQCSYCSKSFVSKGLLNQHNKVHG